MKILKLLIITALLASALWAQENSFVAGANASYNLPVAGMAQRFNGAFGGSVYLGKQVDENLTWTGKLDYFKLTELNSDELKRIIEAEVDGENRVYTFDLPLLEMEFTAAGLSAEAKYNVLKAGPLETNVSAGFGFYYWEFSRNGYYDSLMVDSSGAGDMKTIEALEVPPMFQRDWSGTLNLGLEFNLTVFEPMAVTVGAGYKLIVGELWPTHSLDLENVSGLQFIEMKAGIRLRM